MNYFGVLYRYECKKLFSRKIVWIVFLLCMVIIIFSLIVPFMGDYIIDGQIVDTNYNLYQTDKQYEEALSGREINQSLIEETIAAYRKIPEIPPERHYTSTEEYQQYARPYSAIFTFIRRITGLATSELMLSWQPSEADMYVRRQKELMSLWEDMRLSDGEMDFWRKREEEIRTPYVYQEHSGYGAIISSFQTVGIFALMIIAICLSGIFSDEHARKTDQIILCSPLGKTKLYMAKIMTGVSFAVVSTILFFAFIFIATVCVHGAEGFGAAFQLIYPDNSDPITCGQAVMIAYGNMMAAAVIVSISVMVLSELLHSSIATLAVSTVLLIMSMMVMVPEQYRVPAQIWDWFPWCFLSPWNVFGKYTVSLFGHYLTPWQAVPVIYLVVSAIIAAIGKPIYQRFQVSGR